MPDQPNVSPVRGMRDLLPAECELRDWAVGRILDTYRRFSFARIRAPVLEHLAFLPGRQGGEDQRLIFKVLQRGAHVDRAAGKAEPGLGDDSRSLERTLPRAGG